MTIKNTKQENQDNLDVFHTKRGVKAGIIASLPIAIGYIPIAITFGIIAQAAGLDFMQTLAMSIFIFAGASQFVGVNLITMGVPFIEIVLATFMLNFRHFLMSSSLMTKLAPIRKRVLAVIGFGVTDETFALASMQSGKLSGGFLLGLNLTAYTAWVFGTGLGVLLAAGIPPALQSSMGIALYAMFIGLLVPNMKKSLKVIVVVIVAGAANIFLHNYLSLGWSIILATITGTLIGTLFFKGGKNNG